MRGAAQQYNLVRWLFPVVASVFKLVAFQQVQAPLEYENIHKVQEISLAYPSVAKLHVKSIAGFTT